MRKMKTKSMVIPIAVLLVILVSASSVAPAEATPPTPASGAYKIVSGIITELRYADGNMIKSYTNTITLTGNFEGTIVSEERQVIKLDTGKGTVEGLLTMTGTVDGVSGTLLIRITGKTDGAFAECRWVILSGTDGLANLRGQGTFSGTVGVGGTYSGQYHFEP